LKLPILQISREVKESESKIYLGISSSRFQLFTNLLQGSYLVILLNSLFDVAQHNQISNHFYDLVFLKNYKDPKMAFCKIGIQLKVILSKFV